MQSRSKEIFFTFLWLWVKEQILLNETVWFYFIFWQIEPLMSFCWNFFNLCWTIDKLLVNLWTFGEPLVNLWTFGEPLNLWWTFVEPLLNLWTFVEPFWTFDEALKCMREWGVLGVRVPLYYPELLPLWTPKFSLQNSK